MDINPGCPIQRPSVVRRRLAAALFLAVVACSLPATAGKRDARVRVESNPPGALVSVHATDDTELGGGMIVAGKANIETGGMKAGKIGIMAVGTASSFASGYSNAMANGNDFFTYTIYLPSFAEGMGLEALLVETRGGAVRWANKGRWKPLPLDRPEVADAVVADLLSGRPLERWTMPRGRRSRRSPRRPSWRRHKTSSPHQCREDSAGCPPGPPVDPNARRTGPSSC